MTVKAGEEVLIRAIVAKDYEDGDMMFVYAPPDSKDMVDVSVADDVLGLSLGHARLAVDAVTWDEEERKMILKQEKDDSEQPKGEKKG